MGKRDEIIEAAVNFYQTSGKFPTSNDTKVNRGFPCGERIIYSVFGDWSQFKRACGLGELAFKKTDKEERDQIKNNTRLEHGCWVWTGRVNEGGYGVLKKHGRSWLAHRWSYHVYHGICDGYMVRHKCGNRLCVNPEHLCLGDSSDNAKDTIRMGRYQKGEQKRLFPSTRRPETLVEWVLENGVRDDDGCLVLEGAPTSNGYACLNHQGTKYYAHRFIKCVDEGIPFDTDLVVRHLCHNRLCVNPEHLAFGTRRDNALDTIARRKYD